MISRSVWAVRKYESDNTEPPGPVLRKIAEVTGKPLSWFLSDSAPEEATVILERLEDGVQNVRRLLESSGSPVPSNEREQLRHRPGFQALVSDPRARADLGLTEADVEASGRIAFPEDLLPMRTKRSARLFLRLLQEAVAADED